jgi:hypothetical protein
MPLVLAMMSAAAALPVAADSTVVVYPGNMHGWVWWDDTSDTPTGTGKMVFGPGNPHLGVGSAELAVQDKVTAPTRLDRQALRTTAYQGTRLADITNLDYWTYTAQALPLHAITLQFDIQYQTSESAYQGRLVFEPGYYGNGPILPGQWQEWSPMNGNWWATGLPGRLTCGQGSAGCSWTLIKTLWADAHIGSRGALLFKAGGGWVMWKGNVDAFTIGIKGDETTYDFEPVAGCREGDGNGDFQGNNGNGNFQFDGDGCRDGDSDNVSSSNRGDGKAFQSTSINSIAANSSGNAMTITGTGTMAGVPVGFVMVAVERTSLTPGWVSFTFSDGYTNAGTLLNGSVLLH